MSTSPRTYITPEEYLEIERKAQFRSEYFQGEMFAMAGASRAHNIVTTNALAELREKLRSGPCEVYSKDMRVYVPATGLYAYPDLVIVCDKPQFKDGEFDTLLNPVLLGEVLSPSTEFHDSRDTFDHFRTIPSLQEYLLLASERMHADWFTRGADGKWILSPASAPEDSIEFTSIPCRLVLKDLYEKVEFSARSGMRPLNS